MNDLTDEEIIDLIISLSEEMMVSAYEFGEKTSISTMGAHNILTRESKNPRRKTLIVMLDYLEKKKLGSQVAEPAAKYGSLDQYSANQIVDYIFNNKEKFKDNEMYKMLLKIENNEEVIARLSTIIKEINLKIEKGKAS